MRESEDDAHRSHWRVATLGQRRHARLRSGAAREVERVGDAMGEQVPPIQPAACEGAPRGG